MNIEERLLADYEATTKYLHSLAESRLKLLAFVPTVTGLALATFERLPDSETSAAIGLFGFLVTLGFSYYDQRNTTIYDAMQIRAKTLEAYLGLPISRIATYRRDEAEYQFKRAGAVLDRPQRGLYWFKLKLPFLKIWHDCGLALVYSAALGAWTYVAAVSLADVWGWPFPVVPITTTVVWCGVLTHYLIHDTPTDVGSALLEDVHRLLQTTPPDMPEKAFSPADRAVCQGGD